jgi:hypothetical protein
MDKDDLLVINPDISEETFDKLDDTMKLTLSLVANANEKRDGAGISQIDLTAALWLHQQIRLTQQLLDALLSGAMEATFIEGDEEPQFRSTKPTDEVGN